MSRLHVVVSIASVITCGCALDFDAAFTESAGDAGKIEASPTSDAALDIRKEGQADSQKPDTAVDASVDKEAASPTDSQLPESQLPESQLPESQLPESQLPESQLPEANSDVVQCTSPADCVPTQPCIAAVCTSGACVWGPSPANTPCATGVCNGVGACVECVLHKQCSATGPCDVPGCVNNTCQHTPAPAGSLCEGGHLCNTNGDCVACSGDLSCPDTGECVHPTCVQGVCGSSPDAVKAPCLNGQYCDGQGHCVECFVDSDCPTQECHTTTCSAVGYCHNDHVPQGQTCSNGGTCNSTGHCLRPLGAPCSTSSDCVSHYCQDDVCCDTLCIGLCVACTAAKKGAGSDGTCGDVAHGTDPNDDCPTNWHCDGQGNCHTSD